jgi:DNA-binding FrmR family transcriptional regulator
MGHVLHDQKKILTRIRRIKGQAEALEKALEQGGECIAILQQIAAIRGAANGLMVEVLDSHIREHLGDNDISPEQRLIEVEEVAGILKSYLK